LLTIVNDFSRYVFVKNAMASTPEVTAQQSHQRENQHLAHCGGAKTRRRPNQLLTADNADQLIRADKPKTFEAQRGVAATKNKVKNFTAEVARKSGERRGNLTTKEHDVRAKDTQERQRESLQQDKTFTDSNPATFSQKVGNHYSRVTPLRWSSQFESDFLYWSPSR
jgi:hypothetical protein